MLVLIGLGQTNFLVIALGLTTYDAISSLQSRASLDWSAVIVRRR
ncbi:hypothetical protein [Brenneria tiliae]|nr:hypothetical protein [Brenneria tiliae]